MATPSPREITAPQLCPASTETGRPPGWILWLFGVDLLLGALFVADWAAGGPSSQLHAWLDIETEQTVATWYSSIQLFAVAVLLGAFAWGMQARGERDRWLLLPPALFLFLSADEVIEVHEYVGYKLFSQEQRAGSAFDYVGIWGFVLGPIFLAVVGWIGWHGRRHLRGLPRVRRRYILGLLLFAGGAAFVDEAANFVQVGGAAHALQVLVEEVAEMAGVTFILWATWDLLAGTGLAPRFDAAAAPAPRQMPRPAGRAALAPRPRLAAPAPDRQANL